MKRSLISFLVIFSLCIACAPKHTVTNTVILTDADRDGTSYEKAAIMQQTHEWQGILEEHAWLAKQYPGYTIVSRKLQHAGRSTYDVNQVLKIDGQTITVYLDITNFFGKK